MFSLLDWPSFHLIQLGLCPYHGALSDQEIKFYLPSPDGVT